MFSISLLLNKKKCLWVLQLFWKQISNKHFVLWINMVNKQHMIKQNIYINRTNIGKQAIIISEQTAVLNPHGSKLTQIRCKSELIH